MRGQLGYYATRSGLAAGTLADHMLAYYSLQLTVPVGTYQINDAMLKYFQGVNADTSANLGYQQYRYYNTALGSPGGTLTDVMAAFFLVNGS